MVLIQEVRLWEPILPSILFTGLCCPLLWFCPSIISRIQTNKPTIRIIFLLYTHLYSHAVVLKC